MFTGKYINDPIIYGELYLKLYLTLCPESKWLRYVLVLPLHLDPIAERNLSAQFWIWDIFGVRTALLFSYMCNELQGGGGLHVKITKQYKYPTTLGTILLVALVELRLLLRDSFFPSQISPNLHDLFQPNFHETSTIVNIKNSIEP